MSDANYDAPVAFRLSDETRQMAHAVAEHYEISRSDVIRMGIREQFYDLPEKYRTEIDTDADDHDS